jgi:hypothetical protein
MRGRNFIRAKIRIREIVGGGGRWWKKVDG